MYSEHNQSTGYQLYLYKCDSKHLVQFTMLHVFNVAQGTFDIELHV